MNDLDALRYPVGKQPRYPDPLDANTREQFLGILEQTPATFRALVEGLSDAELEIPYRPGGWTVRQVVHHVPDSHMNAYIRMKLAVTEDSPQIKTYEEDRWAELTEARTAPVEMSLALLDSLHRRWVSFLRALTPGERQRTFRHPAWGVVTVDEALGMYSWHCRHHTAHIEQALATRARSR